MAARNWHWGAVGFYYTAPATSSVKKASDDLAADMTDVDRIDQVDKFNRKMRRLNIPLQATVPFGPGLAWPERTTGGAALTQSPRPFEIAGSDVFGTGNGVLYCYL